MSAILNTYNRKKISFKRGKGSFLYATNGKKYLDFVQGIAVNCLGHSNVYLNRAIQKYVEDPIAERMLDGDLKEGDTIKIGFSKGDVTIEVETK